MYVSIQTHVLLFATAMVVIGAPQSSSIFDAINSIDDDGDISDALADFLIKDIQREDKKNNSLLAKAQSLTMNATHYVVTLDDGRTLFLASPKIAMTFIDASAIPNEINCSSTKTKVTHDQPMPMDIPDTGLKTRTNYKLSLKRFPGGVVTWTDKSNDTYNFVQIDNDPSHRPKYGANMKWFHDSQWQFIPVLHEGNETGWYGLRNGGRKGAYLTFIRNGWISDEDDQGCAYHVVLDRSYPGTHKKGDFFLKPVRVEEEGEIYYQIQLKNLPQGVVTWSATKYGDKGSYYIQADNRNHYDKYKIGGEWYEDTMFVIEEIKEEQKVDEEEEIGDLERD